MNRDEDFSIRLSASALKKRQRPAETALLLLFVWGAGAVFSASASAQTPRFVTEYRLDRETVEVPFEYRNHLILIKGQINDRKDLTLLFDTGATSLVLDKALGISGTHIADTQFQEAEGMTKAEAVWIDRVSTGAEGSAVQVRNVSTLLTDLSQMSRLLDRPLDGVFGMSCMAGYTVEIDYQKKKLRFLPSRVYTVAGRKPDNKTTFLFDLKPVNAKAQISTFTLSGLLHTEYDQDFLVDSGYAGFLTVGGIAAQTSGILKPDTPRVSAFAYSVSRKFQTLKIRTPFLKLGPLDLSGRVIAVDYRNNDAYGQFGIAGNRLWQNFSLTFDFQRKKLWIERRVSKDQEELDEAEHPSLGITIRTDGLTVLLETVPPNSPASKRGLRPGDRLLSIDGVPTDRLTTAQVANLLANPKKETRLRCADKFGNEHEAAVPATSPLDWQ